MSISQQIPDHIKAVSRALGFALLQGGYDRWAHFGELLGEYSATDKAALTFVALRRQDRADAIEALGFALSHDNCDPLPPLFNYMDEAAFWADSVEPAALDAYCLASFKAMPRPRQAAFLDFVQGRQAA